MSTKKDFPSVFESLPSKLTIGNGIELETNKRRHTGQNNLNDIIWYEYKIVNYKEKNLEYDNICISFCKVTELERQNAYKEEDQYIIIRWKGGKMKVDAVSQCPSRRMDMQQWQTD